MTAMPLKFSASQRVKSTDDFRRCYNSGQRAGDGHLLVFAVANQLSQSRLGVSVSKKHGNAVARNRKKRLLRDSFRQLQHQLPLGFDLVLVPRQRTDSTGADLQKSLQRLVTKLVQRLDVNAGSTE